MLTGCGVALWGDSPRWPPHSIQTPPPTTAVPPPVGDKDPWGHFWGALLVSPPPPPPFPKGVTPKALWGSDGWQQRGAFIAHGDNVSDSSGGGARQQSVGGCGPHNPPQCPPHRQRGGNVPEMESSVGGAPWGTVVPKNPKRWRGGGPSSKPPPKIKGKVPKGGGLPKPQRVGVPNCSEKGVQKRDPKRGGGSQIPKEGGGP